MGLLWLTVVGENDPCAAITVVVTATATNPTLGQSDGKITASATALTLTKMPLSPQPNLTAAEKQIITDWINAGHGFGN